MYLASNAPTLASTSSMDLDSKPLETLPDDTQTPPDNILQPVITAKDTPDINPSSSRDLDRVPSRAPSAKELPKFSFLHEVALVAIVTSAQLLTQAGLAQSIAPLHIIGDSFAISNPRQLSWLPAAYSLTVGTFILIAGRLGDLYGHKLIFVLGYFWFGLWSLIAGFSVYSHSFIFFALCRALQGIGPALLLPNGIAVLSRTYPPGDRKNMVMGLFGATAPGGFVLGAVFSGLFAQLLWWPWAYWVLGIVCAVAGILAILLIPAMPIVGEKPKVAELDPLGSALGVAGLILVNFAWNQGASIGWPTVYVYVLLIFGVTFLIAFFYVESHVAEFPLLPASELTRNTYFVFGCIALGWASFGIWIYYFWQFLELQRHQTVLLCAAQSVPIAFSGLTAAITTGFLISRYQPGYIMLCSMTAFCVGAILLATMPVHQTYWAQTFVATIVTPFGMDMSFPAAVIVLSNTMSGEHQGLAASLVNTVLNYSISIGLGIAGTIEGHVDDQGTNLLKGYRGAWYFGISVTGLGMIVAMCLIFSWRHVEKTPREELDISVKEEMGS